jgi:hypothetical protein
MKKIILAALTLAAAACAPMRHPATLAPENASKTRTAQPAQQTAQPQAQTPPASN